MREFRICLIIRRFSRLLNSIPASTFSEVALRWWQEEEFGINYRKLEKSGENRYLEGFRGWSNCKIEKNQPNIVIRKVQNIFLILITCVNYYNLLEICPKEKSNFNGYSFRRFLVLVSIVWSFFTRNKIEQ